MKNLSLLLFLIPVLSFGSGPNLLFLGTGDFDPGANNQTYEIDLNSNTSNSIFAKDIWGMTADLQINKVYYTSAEGPGTDGSNLWSFPVNSPTPVFEGIITSTSSGNQLRIDGLGIVNGNLYGVQQFISSDPPGIYRIDRTTLEATFILGTDDGGVSGIDGHPTNGLLYGANDQISAIESYDPTTMTTSFVANYPVGETDIDGVALDDQNNIYLITDEPGDIYIYNLNSGTYSTISSPITNSDTFSGGAAFFCIAPLAAAAIPTLSQWGLFLFGLIFFTLGTVLVFNRKLVLSTGSGSQNIPLKGMRFPFDINTFKRSLLEASVIGIIGFALIQTIWGEILPLDIAGVLISVPIVAYLLQLFKMYRD